MDEPGHPRARPGEAGKVSTPKIGLPDRWRDYSALEIDADDLLGTSAGPAPGPPTYELAKIGKPVTGPSGG